MRPEPSVNGVRNIVMCGAMEPVEERPKRPQNPKSWSRVAAAKPGELKKRERLVEQTKAGTEDTEAKAFGLNWVRSTRG